MGEKEGGGMDYGVDEPTSSLDDSRSTSMVGAREGLARRMETDANIRDLNARIPDVQTGMPLLNNQDMSRDFFVNRASRGLQSFTDPIASFFMGPGYASEPASFSPLPASTNLGRGDDFGIVNQEMIRMSPFEQGIAALTGRGSDRASERRADYMTPLQVGSPSPLPNVRPSVMPVVKTKPIAQPFAPPTQPGDPRRYDVNPYGPGVTDAPRVSMGVDPFAPPAPPSEAERRAMERKANYMLPLQQEKVPFYEDMGGREAGDPRRYDVNPYGPGVTEVPKIEVITKKVKDLASGAVQAKTPEDKSLLDNIKTFMKKPGATILGFLDKLLAGGTEGPGGGAQLIPFTQDTSGRLFPVSGGPGPYVGGGVPSPSGVGGAPSPIQCPPGFKFDPVLNQCVPIVAPAPPVTTPPAPGTTAPAPATGGISNIPNVYPFTLTPPIGAPIGNIAPVRS
jgi:hypothetical protein